MTTFHEPPPQSRRAVRQSERGEASPQVPASSLPYSFDPDAPARETPPADAPAASGRRAQPSQFADAPPPVVPAAQPGAGFEPLTYVTQARPPLPTGEPAVPADTAPQRQAPPATEAYSQQTLASQPPPTAETPAYRVRDFSPEGRRSVINREQFLGVAQAPPPAAPVAPTAPPTAPVDLDYFTQGTPSVRSHAAVPPKVDEQADNHTLTRRELRELRAAQQEPPALQLPEPIDALLNSGPIEIPTLSAAPGQSQALADAMAEFDALTRGRREAEARAAEEQVASLAAASVPVAAPPVVQPFEPPPPVTAPVEQLSAPIQSSVPVLPSAPVADVPPVAADTVPQPAATADPVFLEPERVPSTRPVGHWSVQAQIDDDEQSLENTISRTVGAGSVAVTTSALVLPSVPQSGDLTSPFSSTGEILVTGSIDLPRSLSSTGAHPHRVDNSDFEDDPLDREVASPDSAPVRAIRAVSTHTSTRGVIESKRPQNNRMPTVMIIAASVLAVGVVGLLVAAAVMHLFS